MSPTPPQARSLAELSTPHGDFMPRVDRFDTLFWELEQSLSPDVPKEIRQRITTTRNLAVYGGFSYDLLAVSFFWSLTCIEMAIWQKSREMKANLNEKVTFTPLVRWARREKLLPDKWSDQKGSELLAKVRNFEAHPKRFSTISMPSEAIEGFEMMIEIVNSLWPFEAKKTKR